MKILICDYHYAEHQQIVEAVELIPEMVLPFSKRRIPERGACADCAEKHFPSFPTDRVKKRRADAGVPRPHTTKEAKIKTRSSKSWETRRRRKSGSQLWNTLIATSKKIRVPVGDLNRTFSQTVSTLGMDKHQVRTEKIKWLKALHHKNDLPMYAGR